MLENSDNDSNQSDDSEPSNNEVELDPIVAFQNAELLLGNAENEVRQKLFVLIDITQINEENGFTKCTVQHADLNSHTLRGNCLLPFVSVIPEEKYFKPAKLFMHCFGNDFFREISTATNF